MLLTKCDICGIREQGNGGWIGDHYIVRACDKCKSLPIKEAISIQQYRLSCITFAGDGMINNDSNI